MPGKLKLLHICWTFSLMAFPPNFRKFRQLVQTLEYHDGYKPGQNDNIRLPFLAKIKKAAKNR